MASLLHLCIAGWLGPDCAGALLQGQVTVDAETQNLKLACRSSADFPSLQASLQGPTGNATVAAAGAPDTGACQLAPTVRDAGSYDLTVFLGSSMIAGSPFQLQVRLSAGSMPGSRLCRLVDTPARLAAAPACKWCWTLPEHAGQVAGSVRPRRLISIHI